MKSLSRDQITTRKEQAERFVRGVLGDDERADEIADESIEDYAERRKIHITNPQRRGTRMSTKQELQERIRELEEENEELSDQLEEIADIVSPDGEESEEGEEEGFEED
jgi:hypothetical protein